MNAQCISLKNVIRNRRLDGRISSRFADIPGNFLVSLAPSIDLPD